MVRETISVEIFEVYEFGSFEGVPVALVRDIKSTRRSRSPSLTTVYNDGGAWPSIKIETLSYIDRADLTIGSYLIAHNYYETTPGGSRRNVAEVVLKRPGDEFS